MLSVNQLAVKICRELMDNADEFNVKHTRFKNGVHLIDTGNKVFGGTEVGLHVTEICLGGVDNVSVTSKDLDGLTLPAIEVSTDFPVLSLCVKRQAVTVRPWKAGSTSKAARTPR